MALQRYSWPATVHPTEKGVFLSFTDWPDLAPVGDNVNEAVLNGGEMLSAAVMQRIRHGADIPAPSDLGPRQLPIPINDAATAQLNRAIKDQQLKEFREQSELEQLQRERRSAFLTEFRANLEPVERSIERADAGAQEFAVVAVKTCYLLNAGGLVAMPAILQALSVKDPSEISLFWPSVIFAFGILVAAITNFLAYRSLFEAAGAWGSESSARAQEVSGSYYPPNETEKHAEAVAQHRVDFEIKIKSANRLANAGLAFFAISMASFLIGLGVTIAKLAA